MQYIQHGSYLQIQHDVIFSRARHQFLEMKLKAEDML